MQITLAFLALVALSFGEAKPFWDEAKPFSAEPKFCHGIECPHFKTINKTDKYEVRFYPTPYKWASTVVAGRKPNLHYGFQRCNRFRYIQLDKTKSLGACCLSVENNVMRLNQIEIKERSTLTSLKKAFRYAFDSYTRPTTSSDVIPRRRKDPDNTIVLQRTF